MAPKLGILAGSGELPLRLIDACRAADRSVFVLALQGAANPDDFAGVPHASIRLGAGAEALRLLRENGVQELVMAGPVRRPTLASIRPDWRAAKFLARIGLRALGDDGLLSAIIKEFEFEGFRIVGLHDLLESLVAPEGSWGKIVPDAQALADVARGLEVARALGAVDVGQAVVVQQGIVLGLEAAEGTDALIERAGRLQGEGPGGVLIKAAKPGQERRADLPTVGAATVHACARAGLRGIAIEAGMALVIDRPAVVAAADGAGLFVVGVKRS
ncbi:MAG TPA: UDP-2,3-diacylglucosamine diphosphatase LpxI [Stellaceae bacterium]|nr:UDP-2,3-diacylglucosamine diphosphatase LpxI [Stellaceae bacterium]